MRNRLALRYAIEGDLRFISHHDSLRLFERALARAGLPVRYSEGFNPRPRISIVLPRSVGVASRDELLVVELATPLEPDDARRLLAREVPAGLTVLAAEVLPNGNAPAARMAEYSLAIEPTLADVVRTRAEELLAREHVEVERVVPKSRSQKQVDIRPYLATIAVIDNRLYWTQSITPTGTARPDEVLTALGLPGRDHLHRVCREKVWYSV